MTGRLSEAYRIKGCIMHENDLLQAYLVISKLGIKHYCYKNLTIERLHIIFADNSLARFPVLNSKNRN
jgi:hypothetical protein